MILLVSSVQTRAAENLEIIVPFPPGGTVDIVARSLQQEILRRLPDLATVVVNKPGGDGVIATQYYMSGTNSLMMASTGTSLFLKLTNPNTGFDPINDFVIQGPIATASTVLAVGHRSKIHDLGEFIQIARQRNLTCGTSNAMAVFFGQYISKEYRLNLTLVPYKGSSNVVIDLAGGHIDCAIDVLPVYLSRTDTRIIGLSTPDLSGNFEAPILSKGVYKFENFYALTTNPKLDATIRNRVIKTIMDITKDPQFIKQLASRGVTVNQNFRTTINDKLNREHEYLLGLKQKFNGPGR